jgi:hypothetical protein
MIRHTTLSIKLFEKKEEIKKHFLCNCGKTEILFWKRVSLAATYYFVYVVQWSICVTQWQSCRVHTSVFPELVQFSEPFGVFLLSAEYHENVIFIPSFKLEYNNNNNSILIYLYANLTAQRSVTKWARIKKRNKTHKNKIQTQCNLYLLNNNKDYDDNNNNNNNNIVTKSHLSRTKIRNITRSSGKN